MGDSKQGKANTEEVEHILDEESVKNIRKAHSTRCTLVSRTEAMSVLSGRTHPYARTSAPSSLACFRVLYPSSLTKLGPCESTANFWSIFRFKNGSRETTGSTKSETNEVTTFVKAFAILCRAALVQDLRPE